MSYNSSDLNTNATGTNLGSSALDHSTFGSNTAGSGSSYGGSSIDHSSAVRPSTLEGNTSTLNNSNLSGTSEYNNSTLNNSNPPLGSTAIPGNTTTGPNLPSGSTATGTNAHEHSHHSHSLLHHNKHHDQKNTAATTGALAGAGAGTAAYNTGYNNGLDNTSSGNFDPATQTGNATATGGMLHKAGIGHDPTVNTAAPTSSTVGTAATAGTLGAGAGALANQHNRAYPTGTYANTPGFTNDSNVPVTGTHTYSNVPATGAGIAPVGATNAYGNPAAGTGLASGFAVNQTINPATGAPDYMATQHANIYDNTVVPQQGVSAPVGAATGVAAEKYLTANGLPKRVLMVLTSSTMEMPDGKKTGYYWGEVFYPFEIFKKNGYEVDLTSLTGRAEPDYHSVSFVDQVKGLELGSMNAWRSKSHPLHKLLENIYTPSQVQASNYGIIYFAGGHGAVEDFPTAEAYQRITSEIYERNGIVCAVCHGVVALGNVRLANGNQLLQGRQVTGFSEEGEKQMKVLDFMHKRNLPMVSDTVSRAGGIYQAPNKPFEEFVVDSERIITGSNPSSAGPVAERAVRILEGR